MSKHQHQDLGDKRAGDTAFSRVIVITDKAGQGDALSSMLAHSGYSVEIATKPATFESVCSQGGIPAAIILDTDLSNYSKEIAGAFAALKAKASDRVPVIFASARQNFSARLAAYRMGATRYLPQPVDRDQLLNMIAEATPLPPAQAHRVLLVSDQSIEQQEQAQTLRSAGFDVRVVNDPLLVPDMLENFAAEVLVLCMESKQCSGPELASVLLDEPQLAGIPVIFLISVEGLKQKLQSSSSAIEKYLSKLVLPDQLIATISKRAGSYRQNKEQLKALHAAQYELRRQQQALDSHAIVSITDIHGTIVYVNDKFCEVSRYSREELVGKNHRIIKSGQHPQEFYSDMWDTIVRGNIWHGEVCNRRKNGSFYWVNTSIVPFLDEEGFPYQYISIRSDITHVKENELRLNRSQAFANIGTWDWSIQTGELIWSERIAPLFGHAEGNFAHTYENFLGSVHPDDLQRVGDAIRDCVERGIGYNIEHRCVWPDGSVRWLLQRGDVVRDTQGVPLHMLGLVQDITPRKQAELGIIESNARLEEAQTLAKLGNWEADLASGDLYWSDEIYRIFGQDKAHFSPTIEAFQSAVHPDDRALVRESEQRAAETGTHDVVHRIICPDGTIRYVHELARSQLDEAGRVLRLTGTVQDVTELKLAEQAMLQAKEVAEAASRAKSEFLASISHELRTPLNAILGFSQLFSMDERLPQATRNNSLQIEQAGRHLLLLVNDLIDLSRIEANKLEFAIGAVKVKDVVCDSLNMVQSMANDKGIKIILVQCEVMDAAVLADFNRLRQALINLLTNAVKYNKAQGKVHMICEVLEGQVRIEVTDNGAGIPAEKQSRIFNAFDRLGEERGEVEGTGIGLVITKRIVETMGGKIGFESTEGQGSTFWLEFPVAPGSGNLAQHAAIHRSGSAAPAQPSHQNAGRPAVLYIEDNPMNLRLMQQIFAGKKEWEFRTAFDAERGIEMARANRPDLILMDINLPGMNGFEALSMLQADPVTAAVPVIALTANAMKGDRERGISAGFVDYLTKPLDIPRLMEVLEQQLNKD